jgi:hypothetical protein
MFDLLHRSSEAWSHVTKDFSHASWTDVGIVAAEGLGAAAIALSGRAAYVKRTCTDLDKLLPKIQIELENAEHLFPPGSNSINHTFLDYAKNPFTGKFAPLRMRRVEFLKAGANAAAEDKSKTFGEVFNARKAADGSYHF